jgi:septin family protein
MVYLKFVKQINSPNLENNLRWTYSYVIADNDAQLSDITRLKKNLIAVSIDAKFNEHCQVFYESYKPENVSFELAKNCIINTIKLGNLLANESEYSTSTEIPILTDDINNFTGFHTNLIPIIF